MAEQTLIKLDKEKITKLLTNRCWSLKEMTETAGVGNKAYYRGITTGIRPKTLGKLAKALDVDPEELIIEEVT